jgi:hypothetical protein
MRKQLEIYKVEYEKLSRSDSQTAQNASFYLTQLTVKVHEFFSALNLFPAANSLQQLTVHSSACVSKFPAIRSDDLKSSLEHQTSNLEHAPATVQ